MLMLLTCPGQVYADPAVQGESEVLKQMEAETPLEAGESIADIETNQAYEFHGFWQQEPESDLSADTGLNFSDCDLSETSVSLESGAYCYTLKNGDRMYLSVPSGAVTEEPVQIAFSSENLGIYAIEKDGQSDYNVFAREFRDEGEYSLKLYWIDPTASEGESGFQIPVNFRIGRNVESEKRAICAPEGFHFRSVTVNGEQTEVPDRVLIPETDGIYEIVFEAATGPDVTYSYTVQIDTTPPELKFSQDISGNVRVPVSYEKMETDSAVTVYLDYREAVFGDATLTRGGDYRIVVTDPAGNSRTYRFHAAEDNRRKIVMGVTGGILFLAALLVYMKYIREHMGVL